MRRPALTLLLLASVAGPLSGQDALPVRPDSATVLRLGRQYTEWFYADLGDSVMAHASDRVRERITAAQLSELLGQLIAQVGMEQEVLSEQIVPRDSLSGYLREARFELLAEPLVLAWTLDARGVIYGFFIRPKSAAADGQN
jgi:hypothetical protein